MNVAISGAWQYCYISCTILSICWSPYIYVNDVFASCNVSVVLLLSTTHCQWCICGWASNEYNFSIWNMILLLPNVNSVMIAYYFWCILCCWIYFAVNGILLSWLYHKPCLMSDFQWSWATVTHFASLSFFLLTQATVRIYDNSSFTCTYYVDGCGNGHE
jgi:hypothetical protein